MYQRNNCNKANNNMHINGISVFKKMFASVSHIFGELFHWFLRSVNVYHFERFDRSDFVEDIVTLTMTFVWWHFYVLILNFVSSDSAVMNKNDYDYDLME